MTYSVIAAVTVLVVASVARRYWSPAAARRALRAQHPRHLEWRISCLTARLLVPAVLAGIVLVIVAVTLRDEPPANGWGVALGVAIGVLGNHVDREVSGGWHLWNERQHSLSAVLPTFPSRSDKPRHVTHGSSDDDCQALQFNMCYTSFEHPLEREPCLLRVFAASPHPHETVDPSAKSSNTNESSREA